MSDNKNIAFGDCDYTEKYEKMGVTPRELFCRQNKICYLTLVYDEYEGEKHFGDLYCTDGNEFAPTNTMLNPTYECAHCMTEFLQQILEHNEMTKKLDKKIVLVLSKIGESRARQEGETELYMTRETFDSLEEHLNNTTMFSDETKPLKVTASGDILMFGAKVNFITEVGPNTVMVEPGGITCQV